MDSAADLANYRDRLMEVARDYAAEVAQRPGVVGVGLYGSLASGDLTRFSDVDLFAVMEGELPRCEVEHRLVDGVKVDLIHARLADARRFAEETPRSLWRGGFLSGYVAESLLRSPMESVLADPSGEVAALKRAAQRRHDYRRLTLPDARFHFHRYGDTEEKVTALLDAGDAPMATQWLLGGVYGLEFLVEALTLRKDRRAGAEALGIPEVHALSNTLKAALGPPCAAAEAHWAALRAFWDENHALGVWPLLERLGEAGVADAERLELIGDYNLFWPTYRLHELGRVFTEMELSLAWSRHHLDRGEPLQAESRLWAFSTAEETTQRWRSLADALRDAGYPCDDLVERLLAAPEYQRLGAEVDRGYDAVRSPGPLEEREEALRAELITYTRMYDMVLAVFLSEEAGSEGAP